MLRTLFRTLFWLLALVIIALAIYRLAADQRERLSAIDLLPKGGRFTETAHGRLHSLELGPEDGTPVLLVHGSVGWSATWEDTLAGLAGQGYRAIAVDLPPMGLSDRDQWTDYSRQAQALRLLSFVEARGIRPVLVAHSHGAGAAVEALLTEPEAFQGIILISAALALGEDASAHELPWPLQSSIPREILISASITNPHLTRALLARLVHRDETVTDAWVQTLWQPFQRRGTTDALAMWVPTLFLPPSGAASTNVQNYAGLDLPVALI